MNTWFASRTLGLLLLGSLAMGCSSDTPETADPDLTPDGDGRVEVETRYFSVKLVGAVLADGTSVLEALPLVQFPLRANVAQSASGQPTLEGVATPNVVIVRDLATASAHPSLGAPVSLSFAAGALTLATPSSLESTPHRRDLLLSWSHKVEEMARFELPSSLELTQLVMRAKYTSPEERSQPITLTFAVEADEAPARLRHALPDLDGRYTLGSTFDPVFSSPVELSEAITYQVGDRAPFAVERDTFFSALPPWLVNSQNATPAVFDGERTVTVRIPEGIDWAGRTVPAQTLTVTGKLPTPAAAFDFEAGLPDAVLYTGVGARVAADSDCESGQCLVFEAPESAGRCDAPPRAVVALRGAKHKVLRLRLFGKDESAAQRLWATAGFGSDFFATVELTPSGRADYPFASDWIDFQFTKSEDVLAQLEVLGCHSDLKVVLQRGSTW